jgi:hypothetical protein
MKKVPFHKQQSSTSFALPGAELSVDEFRKWIADSELLPTISLEEAKSTWEKKRALLKNCIR